LERFDADRRSAAVAERVRADFESGIRAGVTATPTAFLGGRRIADDVAVRLARASEIAGDARDPVDASPR
jgi:protein-disulfide isomerase